MSISIQYKLPIVNGLVVIPGGSDDVLHYLTPEQVLTAIPGSTIGTFCSDSTGLIPQGYGFFSPPQYQTRSYDDPKRPQKWVVFPEFNAPGQFPSDWFATLRAL